MTKEFSPHFSSSFFIVGMLDKKMECHFSKCFNSIYGHSLETKGEKKYMKKEKVIETGAIAQDAGAISEARTDKLTCFTIDDRLYKHFLENRMIVEVYKNPIEFAFDYTASTRRVCRLIKRIRKKYGPVITPRTLGDTVNVLFISKKDKCRVLELLGGEVADLELCDDIHPTITL